MTHNNLLCILSFHSWNLIFQLLNFFFLENDSILRSKIRIFIPGGFPVMLGDVPAVSMVHHGRSRRERSSTALFGTSVEKHATLHMINTTL